MRARLHRCRAATLHCGPGSSSSASWENRQFLMARVSKGPDGGPNTTTRSASRSVSQALLLRFNETRIPIRFDIFIYRFAHLALYRPSASPSSFIRPDKTMVVGCRCSRLVRYVGLPFKVRSVVLSFRLRVYSRTYDLRITTEPLVIKVNYNDSFPPGSAFWRFS